MKAGDKVVCVDGKFFSRRTDPFRIEQINWPKEGEVYTVREVVESEYGPGIRLVEVVNSKFYYDIGVLREPAFSQKRFRSAE